METIIKAMIVCNIPVIPYLHKCMIRQNFSMPSPISIKQRTNMTFIELVIVSHLFKNQLTENDDDDVTDTNSTIHFT